MKNRLKRQREKERIEYKQFNLEELHNMFDNEQNSEELTES